MRCLRDEDYIRGEVPLTKRDVRVLVMDALDIKPQMEVLDIGAGTGGITMEMARRGAKVTAVECKQEACQLIQANAKKMQVSLELLEGMAPDILPEKTFHRIFIGGSRGKLRELLAYAKDHLVEDGVVVLTFILLKNASSAMEILKEEFSEVEISLVQTAQVDRLGMLRGNNPIFLLRGVKK